MGYAVYEDSAARDHGVVRWAGYGVPAVCDIANCSEEIDRGMGYRCDDYVTYDDEDQEVEHEGCELHFCSEHEDHVIWKHDDVTPKPDTAEWVEHLLTDESWQPWRDENPRRVAALTALPNTAQTNSKETE